MNLKNKNKNYGTRSKCITEWMTMKLADWREVCRREYEKLQEKSLLDRELRLMTKLDIGMKDEMHRIK